MSPSTKQDGDMLKPLTTLEAAAALRAAVLRLGADIARALRAERLAILLDDAGQRSNTERLEERHRAGWSHGTNPVCEKWVESFAPTGCERCGHTKGEHYR